MDEKSTKLLLRFTELTAREVREGILSPEEIDEKSKILSELGLTKEQALEKAQENIVASYDKKKS